MENNRKSTLRPKRKPLSDCTNTLPNRTKTLIKPPIINKNVDFTVSTPIKSHTSTGSNNSPTSFTHDGGTACRNSMVTADQVQRPKATRKEKGKMVVETPTIELSASLTTNSLQISSSSSPGHSSQSEMQAVQNQGMNVQGLMDKGKNTQGGTACRNSMVTADQVQRPKATRKEKGKMVVETPTIELSASLTTNSLQISSSSSPGHSSHSEMQAVQNQGMNVQGLMDKGKTTENAPVIQSPALFSSKYLQMSSSSGCSFSETSPALSWMLDEERRKAKGKEKMVLETPNKEVSEPSTPHTPVAPVSSSGTLDRPLTEYNRRRPQRGRKRAADKISFPLSCPPDKRLKKTGLELNSGRGVDKSGPHTDPLPVRKKKRSREYEMHVMPKEEVEKLKTYFADIDAFELPVEEVASEDELD